MLGKISDMILNGWLILMSIIGIMFFLGVVFITSGIILIPIILCLVVGGIVEVVRWMVNSLR